MNIDAYIKAKHLIQEHIKVLTKASPCPENLIRLAEIKLSVKFPETYRKFLEEFGYLMLMGVEIYGIVANNPDSPMPPNTVGVTLSARINFELPASFVVISELGDGQIYCLDCSHPENANVIVYWSGYPYEAQTLEIEANNFGLFFLNSIETAIDIYYN